MPECLHSLCNKKTREKIYLCGKKIDLEKISCGKCASKKDLVVCLVCMNVYCKNEMHLKRRRHVVFYDISNQAMVCTYCETETPVMFKREKDNKEGNDVLMIRYKELPKTHCRIIKPNVLRGFQNLGNTCYINALFHILLNIQKFKRGIIKENHPIKNCGSCIICNIKKLIKSLDSDKELTLKELINCIMNDNVEYRNDDQHDIHTFYLNIMEMIQKHSFVGSFVQKIFCGRMRSTLQCLKCKFKRHIVESFCSISLNHTKNLKESLEEYFLDEHMQDKLNCQNCADDTVFSKSLEVEDSPQILVIHIKRFKFITTVTKINNRIEIQEQIEMVNVKYNLVGFVQHRGSIEHGHYVSYMLLDREWYEFDDNSVRKMMYKNVPFQDSYLLFFQKNK
ncbi:Ubiquitin carboxyl-terminal hydrolase 23 [Nosema granulosis]|uniref:Ubiquitin carboxyl-terminal hydrolase 23 n=1 Tax=Nosema granulosis TaxID=83296 RepID=A0A9P6H1Y2_9MICR|nr:Ubiquitin carboxyl-terminal hydrolase 23 [Nosema granulosis]